MNAPQVDPSPRDLGEWKTGDLAAISRSGQMARDVDGVVSQVDARRRIRNEAIGGIALLVCMVVAVFIFFFVI